MYLSTKLFLISSFILILYVCTRAIAIINYDQSYFRNTPAIINIKWECGSLHKTSYCGRKEFGTFEIKHFIFPDRNRFLLPGFVGLNIWPIIKIYHPYSSWSNTAEWGESDNMKVTPFDVLKIKHGVLVDGMLKSNGFFVISDINKYLEQADILGIEIPREAILKFRSEVGYAYLAFAHLHPNRVNVRTVTFVKNIIDH